MSHRGLNREVGVVFGGNDPEAFAQAETQFAADGVRDQAPLLFIQGDVAARGKDGCRDPHGLCRQQILLVDADPGLGDQPVGVRHPVVAPERTGSFERRSRTPTERERDAHQGRPLQAHGPTHTLINY